MSGDKVVVCVDCSSKAFLRSLGRVKDPQRQREVRQSIQAILLLDLDKAPAKYHIHPLTNKPVKSVLDPQKEVPAWTMHVTGDDTLKASFTFEAGKAYFRLVGEHDMIDANP